MWEGVCVTTCSAGGLLLTAQELLMIMLRDHLGFCDLGIEIRLAIKQAPYLLYSLAHKVSIVMSHKYYSDMFHNFLLTVVKVKFSNDSSLILSYLKLK